MLYFQTNRKQQAGEGNMMNLYQLPDCSKKLPSLFMSGRIFLYQMKTCVPLRMRGAEKLREARRDRFFTKNIIMAAFGVCAALLFLISPLAATAAAADETDNTPALQAPASTSSLRAADKALSAATRNRDAAIKRVSLAYQKLAAADTADKVKAARKELTAARTALQKANQAYSEEVAQNSARTAEQTREEASRYHGAAVAAQRRADAAAKKAAEASGAERTKLLQEAAQQAANAQAYSMEADTRARIAALAASEARRRHAAAPSPESKAAVQQAERDARQAAQYARLARAAASQADGQVQKTVQGAHADNKKRVSSATKKIEGQRKYLMFSAVTSGAVGLYMLNRQCNPTPYHKDCDTIYAQGDGKCKTLDTVGDDKALATQLVTRMKILGGPPHTYVGCVLGPAAITNAFINLKQRKKLKKTKSQLEGVSQGLGAATTAGGIQLAGADHKAPDVSVPGAETTDPDDPDLPDLEIEVPCPDNVKKMCSIDVSDGTVTGADSPGGIGEWAADIPAADRVAALEEMQKEIGDDLDEIRKLLTAGASPASPGTVDGTGGGAADTAGDTPAFNFDPLGTTVAGGSAGGGASFSGAAPLDAGGNTPELSAPPDGLYDDEGSGGGGAAAFAGGAFGGADEAADDSLESDGEPAAAGGAAAFAGYSRRRPAQTAGSGGNEPPLSFGNDKVAASGTDIFAAVKSSYNNFRRSGQFVHPSTQGASAAPFVPTTDSGGGGSGRGSSGLE